MSEQGFNSQGFRFQQILLKKQMFTGALNDSCSEKSEAVQQSCFLGNHILKTFSKFTEEHPC